MREFWKWLVDTDAGLLTRIGIGAMIFLALALTDLRRHGPRATRWREYLFLLAVVVVAMAYGAVNDLITSRISWEYFYYFKDLMKTLGATTPPDPTALTWGAAKIGVAASWSAGLIVAVAMLLANNPRPGLPQLPYLKMFPLLANILLCCLACALVLGEAGYMGWLAKTSSDFRELVLHDEFRPYRFMAVYGIHLGAYVGGAIGMGWAVWTIRRSRRRMAA